MAETAIRGIHRAADGSLRELRSRDEIIAAYEQPVGTLWVDVDIYRPGDTDLLKDLFDFHPVAIAEAISPDTRVKLEEFDGYLFLIVRTIGFREETEDDPYDLETVNLSCFLGERFLVTVRCGESKAMARIVDLVAQRPALLAGGPARLLHVIVNESLDEFFPILDGIEEFLDQLQERVFTAYDQASLKEIFHVKRLVLTLRRHLSPQRDVFTVLANRPSPLLTADVQRYFRDSYDKVLRINDGLETYRELLGSTMESYLTQVSNRLGSVTKALSVVATISVPFVVISGMWGMNVPVPFGAWPYGFEVLLAAQVLIALLLLVALKWRKVL